MKRIALRFLFLCAVITLGTICTSTLSAQDVEELTAARTDVLSRKYLRPSRSVIFATDGSAEARKLVDIMKSVPNDQFDTNKITLQQLRVTPPEKPANTKEGRSALQKEITKALEAQRVGRQIMKCWFPTFDNDQKGYSLQVLEERGAFAATDADVVEAKAGQRDLLVQLNTLGEQLIDRSYVVVYYIYLINDKSSKITGKSSKKAEADAFVYKLDFGPETMNNFYSHHFNSPQGIEQASFPLKFVYATDNSDISSLFKGLIIDTSISDDPNVPTDYDELADVLLTKTNTLIANNVHDFKTQVTIANVNPISAKIGLKENLKTDDRFYVVENVLDPSTGEPKTARRGAVRVGRHIADNNFVADGNLEDFTHFYQYAGFGKLEEGMTLISKPDLGLGITPLVNTAFLGFETDYRVPRLTSRKSKNRGVPGLFVFGRFAMSFSKDRPLSSIFSGDESAPLFRMTFGLRKEFNFVRVLNASIEAGLGTLHDFASDEVAEGDSDWEAVLNTIKGFGVSFGARFGCYIHPSINLFTHVGYDLWLVDEESMSPYNIGLGMRFSF